MKSYKELGIVRLGIYGSMIYTLYKAGQITEEQISILRGMPNMPNNNNDVFDIIDKAFEKSNHDDALDNFRKFTGM